MIVVLRERPGISDPLAWFHWIEAGSVADELRRAGKDVRLLYYDAGMTREPPPGRILLRLSDPVMRAATTALTRVGVGYLGPGAEVLERCYDKYTAVQLLREHGIDCPATRLAHEAADIAPPRVIKPRQGSDSIGVRVVRGAQLPRRRCNHDHIVQALVTGIELTVAVLGDRVGIPIEIQLPAGTPYSFWRKYLLRPRMRLLGDAALVERTRAQARETAAVLEVDWAVRIDAIYSPADDRIYLLECDAAPMLGAGSAFAASLEAAGVDRAMQLEDLLGEV